MKTEVLFLNHFMCMRCFRDMRRVRSRLYGENAIFSMSKDRFQDKYRIDSARAKWHDYDDGFYFVTICTKNREYFFGTIENGEMILSETGKYAEECIRTMETIHNDVTVPLFQIMPNHIHCIIIVETPYYDVSKNQNDDNLRRHGMTSLRDVSNNCGRLSHIISRFKSAVTKFAKEHDITFAWQTRFHDHIIRNQKEMDLISEYIENNVRKWKEDCFYC